MLEGARLVRFFRCRFKLGWMMGVLLRFVPAATQLLHICRWAKIRRSLPEGWQAKPRSQEREKVKASFKHAVSHGSWRPCRDLLGIIKARTGRTGRTGWTGRTGRTGRTGPPVTAP